MVYLLPESELCLWSLEVVAWERKEPDLASLTETEVLVLAGLEHLLLLAVQTPLLNYFNTSGPQRRENRVRVSAKTIPNIMYYILINHLHICMTLMTINIILYSNELNFFAFMFLHFGEKKNIEKQHKHRSNKSEVGRQKDTK